jgi:ABC-type multidrug transport system ATPase subunit
MFGNTPMLPSDLMFVPQYDELKDYSTVLQQMEYVGLMKCRDVGAMKNRLLKLLKILGLFGKAHTMCKDLSGGEKKRLSVGMGMISSPNVLFLDEPTSGLDSTAAFFLVKYLVCLAKTANVAVIVSDPCVCAVLCCNVCCNVCCCAVV